MQNKVLLSTLKIRDLFIYKGNTYLKVSNGNTTEQAFWFNENGDSSLVWFPKDVQCIKIKRLNLEEII